MISSLLFLPALLYPKCAVLCLVAQSCPALCYPMGCSLPGSSVHGILQARILEWVTISLSRGSSRPRDRTQISCKAGRVFTAERLGKPFLLRYSCPIFSPLQLSLTFEKQTLLFSHSQLYHAHWPRCKNLPAKRLKCSMGVGATFTHLSTRGPG